MVASPVKLLLLSAGSSVHTARWANGLSHAGVKVHLATQHPMRHTVAAEVDVIQFPYLGNPGYVLMSLKLRRLARAIQPDILNAHFASGYGTTGRLINCHPYLLSVWGSDVYSVPTRSALHRRIVQKNLLAADVVASTSHCMARQVRTLAPQIGEIPVTPFGVDLGAFSGLPALSGRAKDCIVIGTVKAMDPIYGVDTLIEAFAAMREKLVVAAHPLADRIMLRLVGGGPQTRALQSLAERLGIADRVTFVGRVPHSEVPGELGKLDIYVALSRQESFGVAVLEAGAAGRPVVVSDASGLAEVVRHGITGLVVPRENTAAAAAALFDLVTDRPKRLALGEAGRKHVRDNYAWEPCVQAMLRVYEQTIQRFHGAKKDS